MRKGPNLASSFKLFLRNPAYCYVGAWLTFEPAPTTIAISNQTKGWKRFSPASSLDGKFEDPLQRVDYPARRRFGAMNSARTSHSMETLLPIAVIYCR